MAIEMPAEVMAAAEDFRDALLKHKCPKLLYLGVGTREAHAKHYSLEEWIAVWCRVHHPNI